MSERETYRGYTLVTRGRITMIFWGGDYVSSIAGLEEARRTVDEYLTAP